MILHDGGVTEVSRGLSASAISPDQVINLILALKGAK